jgi:hypothetical protein
MTNSFELGIMKIHFTKKEYRLLLDMLYIADWVMHSHQLISERGHKEHEALYDKIKSYYREMEAEDIIEYSKETDSYYETREYEEKTLEEFITPYDEDIFWEELVDRLAKRDVFRKIGIEKYNKMELIERIKTMSEAAEQYENEFEEHGLDRVKIMGKDVVVSTS